MKWCLLLLIGLFILAFWPRKQAFEANPTPQAHASSRSERSSRSHRPAQALSEARLVAIADKDLEAMLIARWPAIHPDLPAREPSVMEFIRILREMGRRDGPGALAFLDQLEHTDKEAAWLMARMAVAGGWSLSDPEAAALALLENDSVFPVVRLGQISLSYSGRPNPLDRAISHTAAQIFEAWVSISPDQARQVSEKMVILDTVWSYDILTQLTRLTHPHNITTRHPDFSKVDRNSINAILNNPDRAAMPVIFLSIDKPSTDRMKSLGEPASTQEEWAARNPDHALDFIQQSVTATKSMEPLLVAGMARTNPNYLELLALAPPSQKLKVAQHLTAISSLNVAEMIWQLDGRETTWTLSPDQRRHAAENLIDGGGFTPDEKRMLHLISENKAYSPPELPNKTKRPD